MTNTVICIAILAVVACNIIVLMLATANAKVRLAQIGQRRTHIPACPARGSLFDERV